MTCSSCGSKWSLDDGAVMSWLPGDGPVQWMAKKLNEKKEPIAAGLLKTRVAQSGRVYLRLPDGTLPIAKTAEQRAAELANFGNDNDSVFAAASAKDAVLAAQKKSKKSKK